MTEMVIRVGIVGMALRSPPSGQSAVVAARRRRRFARHICCCRRWGSLAGVLFQCSGVVRNSNVKYYDYLCARVGLNLRGRYCGHSARCLLHKTGGAVVAQLSYSVVECAVLCVYVYIHIIYMFVYYSSFCSGSVLFVRWCQQQQ